MQKIEFKDYPDTSTLINAENLKTIQDNVEISINEVDNKNTNFKNQVVNGWYEIDSNAVPTFTFVSWDSSVCTGVVNSNLDLTSYLSVGMKVKFTQNSAIKYAIITAITSTQLTLFLGTDYSLNNSAISNAYYSMLKAPYGFPLSPDKWSVIKTVTSDITGTTSINWQNLGSLYIDVPIGLFNIETGIFFEVTGTGTPSGRLCISTSATTSNISNARLKYQGTTSISGVIKITHNLTSKTRYYGNVEFAFSGTNSSITLKGANSNYDLQPYIKATSSYL